MATFCISGYCWGPHSEPHVSNEIRRAIRGLNNRQVAAAVKRILPEMAVRNVGIVRTGEKVSVRLRRDKRKG